MPQGAERNSTAVIFVHGQGEQSPMDDLLQLAFSIWETEPNAAQGYQLGAISSVPIGIKGLGDLRCLITDKDEEGRTFQFFQFYWAHLMRDNQIWDVWNWLLNLLAKPRVEVPKALWRFSLILRSVILATVVVALVLAAVTVARLVGPLDAYGSIVSWGYVTIWGVSFLILLKVLFSGRENIRKTAIIGVSLLVSGILFGANIENVVPGTERFSKHFYLADQKKHPKTVRKNENFSERMTCLLDSNAKDGRAKDICKKADEIANCEKNPKSLRDYDGDENTICDKDGKLYREVLDPKTHKKSKILVDDPPSLTTWNLFVSIHRVILSIAGIVYVFGGIYWSTFSPFLKNVLADSSRYFSNDPRNAAVRDNIRSAGVELLKDLHSSGKFDRIIVVAHSLGTVVAYNMLDHYWGMTRGDLRNDDNTRAALRSVEREAYLLDQAIGRDIESQRGAYRQAQRAYSRRLATPEPSLQQHGVGPAPWLVSDLVTLGSPLTYAKFLAVDSHAEFTAKMFKFLRLPACPPVSGSELGGAGDRRRDLHGGWLSEVLDGGANLPLPSAVFAAVRWSNLYFTNKGFGQGDIVGGAVAPIFGRGIVDVELDRKELGKSFLHSKYWIWKDQERRSAWAAAGDSRAYTPPPRHIERLRQAINLFETDENEKKLLRQTRVNEHDLLGC